MIRWVRDFFQRYFSEPEAILLLLIAVGLGVVLGFGQMLMPVLASIVIAYLLEGLVRYLVRWRVPRLVAVIIVFLVFLGALFLCFFGLLPLLGQQLGKFFTELPSMFSQLQGWLSEQSTVLPQFIAKEQIDEFSHLLSAQLAKGGQWLLSFSLASLPSLAVFTVYLVLIPFLVFFFMKDRDQIIAWMSGYLPKERHLATQVWSEVNDQIGNYIRGKVIEIIIVAIVSYVVFAFLGLNYAALLGFLVGVSAVIPYIGAVFVTIPVALVALFQWGVGPEFMWLMIAYTIIQAVDSNVLTPLLFSETVNLHPVAIIVAVLFFGGLWGFWGVFFAIPLATLVKAVLNAWPRRATV